MTVPDRTSGDRRKKNNGDDGKRGFTRYFQEIGQTWLALLIIVPAFIAIFYMLWIQQQTITDAQSSVNNVNSLNDSRIETLTGFYRELNQSNQNMFALMTTVFGAWVAAVVAFFFSAKNQAKAQDYSRQIQGSQVEVMKTQAEAIKKSVSPEEKLSSRTVEQLLNEHPGAKNIISVTMQSTIKDVKQAFGDLSNVVVVDTTQKPLGVLYRMDFTEKIKAEIEGANTFDNDPLQKHIGKITEDFATKNPWNTMTGVRNYAELLLSDNLQIAQAKMKTIGDKPAVRGIVIDSNGRAIGIVDYPMISSVLERE
jgi:hypothetical protein